MVHSGDKIVIIGAGCFGVSTAYHLLDRGYTDITVLEKSDVLPAPDAASNDLNKIVRSSYVDAFYTKFAREAIEAWKKRDEWADAYHECGVIVIGSEDDEGPGGREYVQESYDNDIALGADMELLPDPASICNAFPPNVELSSFEHRVGYVNREGGWVNARQGLSTMLSNIQSLGAKVLPGKAVRRVLRRDDKTRAVECADGSTYEASLVIIATGAWTASTFPNPILQSLCLATGQSVATLQLTPEEAQRYRACPIVLNFSNGFYVFPPNDNDVVKLAIHDAGYTHTKEGISVPRTSVSDPESGHLITQTAFDALRMELQAVYPELAKKDMVGTRLCWYTDSPDGDWVISRDSEDPALLYATAGSGHAFKFLPIIGRLVADLVEDKLGPDLVRKFSISREFKHKDLSRSGDTKELNLTMLCAAGNISKIQV